MLVATPADVKKPLSVSGDLFTDEGEGVPLGKCSTAPDTVETASMLQLLNVNGLKTADQGDSLLGFDEVWRRKIIRRYELEENGSLSSQELA